VSDAAPTIRQATPADAAAWAQLRLGLWPDADDPLEELAQSLAEADGAVFLACLADGEAVGFAEVRLRHDYVNGTDSSPVGFLEGWYVQPQWQAMLVVAGRERIHREDALLHCVQRGRWNKHHHAVQRHAIHADGSSGMRK